jgi:hypothetical protein
VLHRVDSVLDKYKGREGEVYQHLKQLRSQAQNAGELTQRCREVFYDRVPEVIVLDEGEEGILHEVENIPGQEEEQPVYAEQYRANVMEADTEALIRDLLRERSSFMHQYADRMLRDYYGREKELLGLLYEEFNLVH